MAACSCSRLRAVSALKSAKGDREAAITSLNEALSMASTVDPNLTSLPQVQTNLLEPNIRPGAYRSPSPGLGRSVSPSSSHYQSPGQLVTPSPVPSPRPSLRAPTPQENNSSYVVPPLHIDAPPLDAPPPYQEFTPDPSSRYTPPPTEEKPQPADKMMPEPPTDADPSNSPVPRPHAPSLLPDPPSNDQEEEWDFRVPDITLNITEPDFSPEEGKSMQFSLRRLVSGLQSGIRVAQVQRYLSFFTVLTLRRELATSLEGFPSIFYAVATNDEKIVWAWVENGGDPNAVEPKTRVPLLAFAILRAEVSGKDTTAVVMTLLSIGSSISVIPRILYTPCVDDPIEKLPFDHRYPEFQESGKAWCRPWVSLKLAATINLTQRYFLEKTVSNRGPSHREIQVAQAHNAMALLGVGQFLIGQTSATRMVAQKLLSHMALPRSKPLVMAFTGPSGHGKTELAKRMGDLLNLEMERIDCTEMRYETDLFGPKKPYIGHELGSPLNNFLAKMTAKRSIVFLDEFEKTTRDVQNALLIPFDEGRYTDRRNRQAVDCSKAIWILATNAVDNIILDFSEANRIELFEPSDALRQAELMNNLSISINKQLKTEFGTPLTSRLSVTIPFLPFSPTEAAVIAHKFILELKRKVLQSISISSKQLVGHVILDLQRDGAICKLIADEGYDMDQGARSLQAAVESRIGDALVQSYLEEEGQIDDESPVVRYVVDLARDGSLLVLKAGADRDGKARRDERSPPLRAPANQNQAGTAQAGAGAGGYQDFPMLTLLSNLRNM
ncbi:P-loop containing nucleoside triphosphate hydrolase protein [Zopfia rhizophila CBS 207.26]|uniref:P-loop containing nucleoside triphosphate hydrolase protein n=1 Tax=Zopfia rhizophila CBS 207.26 TaxID=1314779 RepID=A0A6A6EUA0_9PEZI|nr:P-loop containing nucleoside triphosphate hydrolase protein [Zopfia rhizophila CBS 207.26]